MDALTIAGLSMQNDFIRLNTISQNLANVLTAGYKREIPVSRTFTSYINQITGPDTVASEAQLMNQEQVMLDASAGTLRFTSNPLDVAIDGDGFMEVVTDHGVAYTRQGNLRVDARGHLITGQGFPIMGLAGEITVSGAAIKINNNGEVTQDERVVGQIKLTRFANPNELVPLGNGLFDQGGARPADGAAGQNGTLKTGYQENSNVSSPQEMIRLTETVRHFESMQRIMQNYNDVMEKAISKLGDF
jgi:flagellar basal-body rod protein FlgF